MRIITWNIGEDERNDCGKLTLDSYNSNNNIILCGDFNYDDVNKLFPKIMENCNDLIDCPTRKDKQLDHFIISDKLKCSYRNITNNIFDHKLGIFDIKTNK